MSRKTAGCPAQPSQIEADEIEQSSERLRADYDAAMAQLDDIAQRLAKIQRQLDAIQPPGWGWLVERRNGKGRGGREV